MRRPRGWVPCLVAPLLCLCGCIDTGQDEVSVPLVLQGTDVSAGAVSDDGIAFTVERADLAFGPLVLCAGATAGDLCETAVLEWLDAVVVDTTTSTSAAVGDLEGITGTVLSYMYDLGISSQLSRSQPFVLEAAEALGDVSFVAEGRATVDGIDVPYRVSVPVAQSNNTELGVPVVRKSADTPFFQDVTGAETGLRLRFDPVEWLRGMDFALFVDRRNCSDVDESVVCDGTLERRCDAGAETSQRDCAAMDLVCVPNLGCGETFEVVPGTQPFRSVNNALLTAGRPTFEWNPAL